MHEVPQQGRRRLPHMSCWPVLLLSAHFQAELYSAQAPRRRPVNAKTWSPFLNSLTALPTDSISPASSCPSIFFLGPLKPNAIRATSRHNRGSLRLRSSQSPAVTVAAWTLISTSLSLGAGFSSSLS